ncbi:MAG: hypothetical protein FJ104_16605, partial [Deltaproteobacteria bacterium]|nr:hypothetical protein [Deltaproteobacteria bacterium]
MASLSSPRASLLPLACLSLVMALSGCSSDDDGAADDGAAADGGGSGGGDSGG